MNWLEIISVKAARPQEKIKIIEICNKVRLPRISGSSAKLTVYGNSVSAEIIIHIQWRSQSAPEGRSQLGRALSHTVSDFGLVSHTLWVEHNRSSSGRTT